MTGSRLWLVRAVREALTQAAPDVRFTMQPIALPGSAFTLSVDLPGVGALEISKTTVLASRMDHPKLLKRIIATVKDMLGIGSVKQDQQVIQAGQDDGAVKRPTNARKPRILVLADGPEILKQCEAYLVGVASFEAKLMMASVISTNENRIKISEACHAGQFSGCMLVVADPLALDLAVQSQWNRLRSLIGPSTDFTLCILDAEGQMQVVVPESPVPVSENAAELSEEEAGGGPEPG
ncbi:hypothetical protein ACEN2J_19550 [Pseudorhodobacter sp. W20_MBD10_FR17]|uniref:hypothetical protein n=1 Tax=Pseudorhodobacter sp. W20_MBD10_FR17 TaxID=3240266 RepID=UPI003F9E75E8